MYQNHNYLMKKEIIIYKQNESEKTKEIKNQKMKNITEMIYGEWVQYAKKIVMDCQKIFLVFQIKMDMSGK